MLAVNYTTLRENLKTYMDKVTDDYERIIITRKENKNVVMLSEESYNNLMENVYIMGNKANYDWLIESKVQLESGFLSLKTLVEMEMKALENQSHCPVIWLDSGADVLMIKIV